MHFGGIRIGTDAGDLHRGWVWRDGEHSSIKEWKVTSDIAADGVTQTATHVNATDKLGRVHELEADVFRVSPGPAGIRPNSSSAPGQGTECPRGQSYFPWCSANGGGPVS